MKGLIEYAINNRTVSYFVCFLLAVGGIASFFSLSQLEDPVFSIKTAVIVTRYPGASPVEVEQEVTDRLEKAIQQMTQLEDIYSISRTGESIITVEIKPEYWSDRLPQVWDELRKKIHDARNQLPPNARDPIINDDFGFVFGFLVGITGDGFSLAEIEDYADMVRKELNLVNGVSRIDFWGTPERTIYLEISEQQLSQLNLTSDTVLGVLKNQNMVVDAGSLDVDTNRFRFAPSGEFTTPDQIGELIIRPESADVIENVLIAAEQSAENDLQAFSKAIDEASNNVIRLRDIAKITPGFKEPPFTIMRHNGRPAIGMQIAGLDTANIVSVGEALSKRIEELMPLLPVGIEINKIAWQSELVNEAVNSFMISLLEALVIVMIVLIIPSGFRMGLIVGLALILTILATFMFIAAFEIPLQRMSLGALIIALGMMVDNTIVVSDGIAVKFRRGVNRKQAAVESALGPAYPLLASTIIAVMAFYPIYASRESAGEYCRTLFIVVAASLLISWVIAMMLTPLQCMDLLPEYSSTEKSSSEAAGEYSGPFFQYFRKVLAMLIRYRYMTMAVLVGMLCVSIFSFGFVKKLFFPDSSRAQLMIDYWAPEGTRIQELSEGLKGVETHILEDPTVQGVSTFIGAGPPRFYLPVDSEKPYPNYAQMIVNFDDFYSIAPFIEKYQLWIENQVPAALVRLRKYGVGPSNPWQFEARFVGPADASMQTLREIGNETLAIVKQSKFGEDWKLDIMNRELKLVPEYDQKRGRWSSVTRINLGSALKRGYDGFEVALYREKNHLYPIVLRNTDKERENLASNLDQLQIKADRSVLTVPLLQVVNATKPQWEDPLIIRWNRRRAVTVQGAPVSGITFPTLKASVIDQIDKMKLPEGYELYWRGEEESTIKAQRSLLPGIVPAVVIILLLLVMLFNAFKPMAIILLTIPFAAIGVSFSLLIFDIPFGFLALLGAMSLAGMMNKNIVVLLDACYENRALGMNHYEAIIEAAVTRIRPVMLAAGTTVLGVIPLIQDVFWVGMAVTIMGGLAFGSLLTLVVVPVLYSILYRVKIPDHKEPSNAS